MDRDAERLVAEAVNETERVILAAAGSRELQESLQYVSRVARNFTTSAHWLGKLKDPILQLMRGRDAIKRQCFLRLLAQSNAQTNAGNILADMVLHFASLLRVLEKLVNVQWTPSMTAAFERLQAFILNEQVPAFVSLMELCEKEPSDEEVRQKMHALLEVTRGVIGYARQFENEALRRTDPSSPRIRETSAFFTDAFGSLMARLVRVVRVYWFLVGYLTPEIVADITVQARKYGFPAGSAAADMLQLVLRPELPVSMMSRDWVLLRQAELKDYVTEQLKGMVTEVIKQVLTQFVSDGTVRQLTDGTFVAAQLGLGDGILANVVNVIEQATVAPAGRNLLDGIGFFVTWILVSTLLTLIQQKVVGAVVARAASLVRTSMKGPLRPTGPVEGYECLDGVCAPRYRGDPVVPGVQLFRTREACMDNCVQLLPPASRTTPRRVSSLSRTTFSPLPNSFRGGYKDIHKQ
jgi:hypothetical protein